VSGRVTVVVPTHDRRGLVPRAIGCALRQRDVEVDVVVVDDGSTDGTPVVLAALEGPRVRVLRHDRPRGVAAARNTGIDAASGEWVAFLDDDDVWAPGKLRAQLDAIGTDGECRWACTGTVVVDEDLRVRGADPTPRERDVAAHLLCYNHVPGGGSGVVAHRDLLADAGGFDPALQTMADWDMWIRLALRSPLASVARPLVACVDHDGMSRAARNLRRELAHLERKYEAERARRGCRLDRAWWLRWFAELDERAGRRASAVRTHLEAALRHGDRRAPARAVLALAGAAAVRRAARRHAAAVPPGWAVDAEEWLAPLRAVREVAS
jgi:glycosyltransferase involved in cell wall biosynthesis